jgi:hypothetical protein
VVSSLHAKAHPGSWVECKHIVHSTFRTYETEAAVSVLPKLLSKIRVLIFAGDQDLICNYVGLENMIKNLGWNGATGLGVGFVFFVVPLKHFDFLLVGGYTNTTVQCRFKAGWHLGYGKKFDLREGTSANLIIVFFSYSLYFSSSTRPIWYPSMSPMWRMI